MVADSAVALDGFSTSPPTMNARPLHSIAKVTELMWLLADAGESCASVAVVAGPSVQNRFRGYPVTSGGRETC